MVVAGLRSGLCSAGVSPALCAFRSLHLRRAYPGPVLKSRYPRILKNISDTPLQVALITNQVVVVFPLPEIS